MSDAEPTGRAQNGRFQPGNPGRPKGTRHAALVTLDAIGIEGAEKVMRKVQEMAEAGDMRAAELLLRRLWPERKGRPVEMELPALKTAADLPKALAVVAAEMAAGNLSPEEAGAVVAVVEAQRRALETEDLAARIAALEARGNGK
jgi:ubiquinone biosynthesis protein UbiJ